MSIASFGTSKLVVWLSKWFSAERLLPLGVLSFVAGLILFATSRNRLWEIFLVMAIVGLSIGASFAVMPRMIMASTPLSQTSSALALNQVLRTVGYSIGSALSATILTAHTAKGAIFPVNSGYTVAAVIAMVLLLGTAGLSFVLPRRAVVDERLDVEQELLAEDNAEAAIAGALTLEYEPADVPR
jgi:predicted MFS family arabinose efflux permease